MNMIEETHRSFRFSINEDGKEIARASLYLIKNDLHDQPYGLLEDVFVDAEKRGEGYGTQVTKAVIQQATACGCYKLIATSKTGKIKVHELYKRLGFIQYGIELRMDFE